MSRFIPIFKVGICKLFVIKSIVLPVYTKKIIEILEFRLKKGLKYKENSDKIKYKLS